MNGQYVQHYMLGGTSTSETLTADYADNTTGVVNVEGARDIMLYVTYAPKTGETNRVLYMQVETGPTTSDLYLLTLEEDTATSGTTENKTYTRSYTGAVGGTSYARSFSLGDIIAVGLRISFKESGTADFGTVKLRILYNA